MLVKDEKEMKSQILKEHRNRTIHFKRHIKVAAAQSSQLMITPSKYLTKKTPAK
jgi:hypothetical protein